MKQKKSKNLETHPTTPRSLLGMLKFMLDEGKTAKIFCGGAAVVVVALVLLLLFGCDRYAMFSVYFVRGRYLLFSSLPLMQCNPTLFLSLFSTDSLAVSVWLFGRLVFYLFACYSFLLSLSVY